MVAVPVMVFPADVIFQSFGNWSVNGSKDFDDRDETN